MNRYQNAKEIATGGQAKIYLADDVLADKKVILKTVKHNNPGSRRRLKREARLLREQASNNFVVNLEADYSDLDPPFIVIEYCSGGSLETWIRSRRNTRDVVLAIQHVLLGLQGIHVRGGFHRDITPRNMQVSFDPDGRWRIKLIDLGLGQTPNPLSGDMTRTYGGTRGYIAPEIEAGDDYTWRADIFSLGLVFRELLTGSKAENRFSILRPPTELSELISEMTSLDPLKRPNTQYVFQKLEAYLNKPAPHQIMSQAPQGSGLGGAILTALAALAIIAANANDYDDNLGRWRDSHGRFTSGMFS
ncbi:MAG TPA: serine/threonine-protein kinase [Pyrinomonadaceae bacterium]|nr:serine/threonine-protein kinase [Pyrinomonadaceae bacterium]